MNTIHLHGHAAQFGGPYTLDVRTSAEAVQALIVQLPGFEQMIRAGSWHVLVGPLEREDDLDEESLTLELAKGAEIHLLPAVLGAGNGGGLSIVLGVVLAVVGVVTYNPGLVAAGAGLIVGGIIQMTMKIPGADTDTESADSKASFLLSASTNRSTQGVAIPRGYGRVKVGSIVISAGLYAENVSE